MVLARFRVLRARAPARLQEAQSASPVLGVAGIVAQNVEVPADERPQGEEVK